MRHTILTFLLGFCTFLAFGQTPEITAGQETTTVGGTVSVPVSVSQFTDVVSVQFTLQWDPTIIQYQSTTDYGLPGLSEFNFGETEIDQGHLTFVWFDGQVSGVSLPDESIVFAVEFLVLGEAGENSPLAFVNAPTPIQIGVIEGVEVNEVAGTFADGSVLIAPETDPLEISAEVTDNLCAGNNEGQIIPTITGGTPPYNYSWTGPNGFVSDAEQLDNLSAGDYELTVTDQMGESLMQSFSVATPLPLVITSLNIEASNCDAATGSIEVEVSGGTPGYLYNFGTGFTSNHNIGLIAGGSYTLTIQDAQNCQIDTLVEVPQANAPEVSLGEDRSLCPGESALIIAETTADVTYSWSRDGNPLPETTAQINTITAGLYQVIVTNAAGCTASDQMQLSVATVPNLDLGPDLDLCPKATAFLLADGNFASYEWMLDGQTVGEDVPELQIGMEGGYTLSAITDEGCLAQDTVQVNLIPFSITVGPDTTIQAGDTLQLFATGGVTYQWSGSPDLSCLNCPNPEVILNQTTTFQVEVSSAEGCLLSEAVTVTVEEASLIDVNIVNFLSPNGDGKNDELIFRGLENYPGNQLSIYNRWGDLLFSKPNYQLDGQYWDATYKGQLLPPGIYFYVLRVGLTAEPIKSSLTIVHQ